MSVYGPPSEFFNIEFLADPPNQLGLAHEGKPICHSGQQPRQLSLIQNEQLSFQKLIQGMLSWERNLLFQPRGQVMLNCHELCRSESVLSLQAFSAE